jgi:hypothetical protein
MGVPRMAFALKVQVPTEKQEHLALMKWVSLKPQIRDLLIHIPNEYDGGAVGGYQRRLMGVKKGVSDILLPLPIKPYHGLWIELKRRSGSNVSVEQQLWIDKMTELGYMAVICYGWEDAVRVITNYLHGLN